MTPTKPGYVGGELDLFAHALNWKAYWSGMVAPYLGRNVLDVGAGIGSTIQTLGALRETEWTALEPDAALAARIQGNVETGELPASTRVIAGTTADLADTERFDSILYIDVLEHIEDDKEELARAAKFLPPGAHLVVLVPAHQRLFTPFDQAIGHHRRYSKRSLCAVLPDTIVPRELRYLDSAGMLASLTNRLLLRSSMPTPAQIRVWDSLLVPLSRVTDRCTFGALGKSLLLVGQVKH